MNIRQTIRNLVAGGGLILLLCTGAAAAPAEVRLPTLTTRNGTYTNVVVTSRTATDIYIRHEGGFGNVKLDDIQDDEALVALGLKAPPVKVEVVTNAAGEVVSAPTDAAPPAESPAGRYQELLKEKWSEWRRAGPRLEPMAGLIALGIFLVIHLFFSFCLKLICVKAGSEPGALVWLPLLQIIPALRAAGMSAAWLLAWLLPVLAMFGLAGIMASGQPALMATGFVAAMIVAGVGSVAAFIGQILWCFKITSARGKSLLVAILLLLPVLNFFAFLYLAFSSRNED
jgi:hypothetical protein